MNDAKRKAIKAYKERNFREQKCRDCGKSTEVNDTRCVIHKRWHQIRTMANRAFMKDFK
jgi:hypothetical protein